MKKRLCMLAAGAAAVAAIIALPTGAADNNSGFHTALPALLTPLAPGSSVKPIISVGDTVRGYRFESIPDGISFTRNGRGTMDVYVNHETSLVPFPAMRSDFTNSLVSRLRLSQHSAGVLRGDYAIDSNSNYQRFCSNFLVAHERGGPRHRPAAGLRMAPAVRLPRRAVRRAGRRRRRPGRQERRTSLDLRHGSTQPRERRRLARLRPSRRALRGRHVRRAGIPALPVLGCERPRALERRGHAVRLRRRRPERQRLR